MQPVWDWRLKQDKAGAGRCYIPRTFSSTRLMSGEDAGSSSVETYRPISCSNSMPLALVGMVFM
jgi:hypothetical protein